MPTKSAPQPQSVLVVDDDGNFRRLLAELFRTIGHEVIEARNSEEGLLALAEHDIGLAIVDFRLPDIDGMTFISQMREDGEKANVVFISSTFCDASTFNRLRNILKVALVLQKPIQPQIFLQQLQGLIPPPPVAAPKEVAAPKTLELQEAEYERLLHAAAGTTPSQPAPGGSPAGAPDSDVLPQVEQIRQKLEVEARIRSAQVQLRQAMPPEWERLSTLVSKAKSNAGDKTSYQAALALAHRMRGTAGSLGLSRVSACAAKIEDYLRMLDPTDETEHEILWAEIIRCLADGETGLRAVDNVEVVETEAVRLTAGHVLIVSSESTIQPRISELNPFIDIQVVLADSAIGGITKAASTRFDSAIIDVSLCGKLQALQLVKELRLTAGNDSLPVALIVPSNEHIDQADMTYVGISATMHAPLAQSDFEQALRTLAAARNVQQPRILTVDDDVILTRFIQTVLRTEGMNVTMLNEPIHVLQVLDEFEPDLVLLDVIMPGLSGYDVCRLIREHPKWGDALPVVFLTAKSDMEGRAAAFQSGGSDFLSKPILADELLARVQAQLDSSRARRKSKLSDEVSGALKQQVFLRSLREACERAHAAKETLALAMISIDYFEELDRYGIFASLSAVSTVGKLLRSRFKAESLRGRWNEQTFVLAVPGETAQGLFDALQYFAREIAGVTLTGDLGKRFELSLSMGAVSQPQDGETYEDLIEAAKNKLQANIRQKTGVTFFS
jgi:diguanylate cyclase (GGDEF)-like protein